MTEQLVRPEMFCGKKSWDAKSTVAKAMHGWWAANIGERCFVFVAAGHFSVGLAL